METDPEDKPLQSNEKINVGVVGACGALVTFMHLINLRRHPKVHMRAFCDLDEEKLKVAAEKDGVDYYTMDVEKLLADPEIQLVVAGLPHEVHKDVVLRAARACRHD